MNLVIRRPFARFVLLGLLAPALQACGGGANTAGPCSRESTQTLVFYDQSASSVLDSATASLFRDTIVSLVETSATCPGDAVRGFLVHANTRGKVDRVDVLNSVALPVLAGQPRIDQALAQQQYDKDLTELRRDGQAKLVGLTQASVDARFRRHTDMLGALEVISEEVGRGASAGQVRVYFFSDMHESMPGPRRDFDRRPPQSRAEAEAWADEDSTILSEMKIDTARFSQVDIRVMLGNLANRPNARNVQFYWERVFQNVGVGNVQYN